MPGIICVGTQWGDEGKGKVTDLLADDMQMVVRYQGGNNAGHTVKVGNQVTKLHLVPSGILYTHLTNIISDGVVVDLGIFIEEIKKLESEGVSTDKLYISGNCHLIMPYHRVLDKLKERKLGKYRIGTTGKGIGPAYADKASRIGIRAQDLFDLKIFRQKLEQALKEKNAIIVRIFNSKAMNLDDIVEEYAVYAKFLKNRIIDTAPLINDYLNDGKKVFFEGAQGTLLDIDHGTYPYVTSSSPVAGYACAGAGVGPLRIKEVIGVTKAYTTRVGEGPFPTEKLNKTGEYLRDKGNEFGTTTGRSRRCGWFDANLVKHSVMVNGISKIFLTKLDVLSELPKLKIAVAYKYRQKTFEGFPPHQTIFNKCKPVYKEMPGWKEDISDITKFEKLPKEARDYVKEIEKLVGVPAKMISVGASRSQTIVRK
jgi:adenylosuccinate synthase